MRAAAAAGIAPAVLHADGDAGVAITAFVEGRPLDDFPGGPEALARALGSLAARLQAIPAFPAVADYPSVVGDMLDQLHAWRGRPSDPVLRARVHLMRELATLFYGCANGLFLRETRPDLIETDMAAPTPAEFSAAILEGRLIQNSPAAQRIGGKVALRAFLEGVTSPAFAKAVAVLRAG